MNKALLCLNPEDQERKALMESIKDEAKLGWKAKGRDASVVNM